MSIVNQQDQTTSAFDANGSDQEYFASTVTCIEVNRSDTTSLRTEPAHVFDIVYNYDINRFLIGHGITPSYVEDVNESIHEEVVGVADNFYYNLGTDTHVIKIAVLKDLANGKVNLTYTNSIGSRTSGEQDDEAAAMALLSKQLKYDGTDITLLQSNTLQDVGSSMEPNVVAEVSSARVNLLANQPAVLTHFLTDLKTADGSRGWYDSNSEQGVHTQVKNGLAQLFDRQPELNNLMGSAASSAAFLDSDKIKALMKDSTNQLHTELFSEGQLREVLDAVSDRGERMIGENADRIFLFQPGDSITAVVKVVDGDSDNTNSDRWLVTLQQSQMHPSVYMVFKDRGGDEYELFHKNGESITLVTDYSTLIGMSNGDGDKPGVGPNGYFQVLDSSDNIISLTKGEFLTYS